MSIRFQLPRQHKKHGWYVCTLGADTMYLHSDMELHASTASGRHYTGYYKTEQEAMDTLVEYIANHLYHHLTRTS